MANPKINTEILLAQIPMFNGLAPGEIARIACSSREIQASKGKILFHKGDPCSGFHVVVSGQIKLAFTSANGNEKVVEIISPGQSFGEAIMFMDKSYIVFAQALVDTQLLHIAKTAMYEELERDPALCRKMLAGMAMRLHQLMNDVESYSLHSGKQRIIGYLLRELPDDQAETGSTSVTLATSKGIVASRLNLTQEHFSRILRELGELGLIVVEGRKIHIPDIAKLQAYEGK
jgi:CRP/FNR family transcriptional regulator, dissimilatory nitrate respiration regulator